MVGALFSESEQLGSRVVLLLDVETDRPQGQQHSGSRMAVSTRGTLESGEPVTYSLGPVRVPRVSYPGDSDVRASATTMGIARSCSWVNGSPGASEMGIGSGLAGSE